MAIKHLCNFWHVIVFGFLPTGARVLRAVCDCVLQVLQILLMSDAWMKAFAEAGICYMKPASMCTSDRRRESSLICSRWIATVILWPYAAGLLSGYAHPEFV